ncbi:hypothetical protein CC1G_10372 [Coprinopsis cinerea okayama7|uniref:Uncharacterized protein n=1 Tax=Coprinopsis cinerea (strain Okayama-7 / 130 / ATCC MYA-4618 / FGSC 9003) TaxID=240176 RepID=A8PEA6_COPC7|nr:hypothetical protein CC1G_10372 [Coprinopsis cinerea okayama7\|eukprot:XP_001840758.1 hypothetical protein CC1G_10372 [Coprinopsis cinerea okayama7\
MSSNIPTTVARAAATDPTLDFVSASNSTTSVDATVADIDIDYEQCGRLLDLAQSRTEYFEAVDTAELDAETEQIQSLAGGKERERNLKSDNFDVKEGAFQRGRTAIRRRFSNQFDKIRSRSRSLSISSARTPPRSPAATGDATQGEDAAREVKRRQLSPVARAVLTFREQEEGVLQMLYGSPK